MSNRSKIPHKENHPRAEISITLIEYNTYLAIISKDKIEEKLLFIKSINQEDPLWITFLILTVEKIADAVLVPGDLEGFLYLPSPDLYELEELELLKNTLQKFADSEKQWDEIPSVDVNGAVFSQTLPRLIQMNYELA